MRNVIPERVARTKIVVYVFAGTLYLATRIQTRFLNFRANVTCFLRAGILFVLKAMCVFGSSLTRYTSEFNSRPLQ